MQSLLTKPALSLLGADRLIAFGVDQPAHITYRAQAVFSDFRSGKQSLLFPGSVFHFKAYQYAAICDLNIDAVRFSFNGEVGLNTAYIGLWI